MKSRQSCHFTHLSAPAIAVAIALPAMLLAFAVAEAAEPAEPATGGPVGAKRIIEGAAVAPSQDYRGGQVEMQLISEVNSVRAGQPFTVGLWIQHAPGWHTYWRNPGVVGVATTFVWDLPEGFTAGPVQWPAPQRTKMATLTAYGYEGECVLLIEIVPPAELADGVAEVALKTKVGWMACGSSCHPGWSDFELTLPVAHGNGGRENPLVAPEWNAQAHELIEAERGRFPEVIEGWRASARRGGSGVSKGKTDGWLELTVHPPKGQSPAESESGWGDVYFFSQDDQVDSDAPQEVRENADGTVTLRMQLSQYAPENPKSLPGVVYRKAGWPAVPSGDANAKPPHQWLWIEPEW